MSKQLSVLMSHLNNDKKVFIDLYESHVLIQVTKDNIEHFTHVDLSDEALELENSTKESKIEYHSQQFDYNTHCFSQQEIEQQERHRKEIVDMLNEFEVEAIYHVDCEADVYVVV